MELKWNEFAILPNSWGIVGVVVLGFVFVKQDIHERPEIEQAIILNHERIHVQQSLELGIIPFYLWYAIEAIFRGYDENRFEKEAYKHEADLNYLKNRKRYNYVIHSRRTPR